MKKIEKVAGIIILMSSVVILATYFLPAFKAASFKDPVLPSMIVFGKHYHTSMSGDGSPISFKIFAYWVLMLTYFLPIIPAGGFWLIQLFKVNKPVKYAVYFITLMSFSLSILFFITTINQGAFQRSDIENPTLLYFRNFKFVPTLWGILTLAFGSLGVLSSGVVLVKDIIDE